MKECLKNLPKKEIVALLRAEQGLLELSKIEHYQDLRNNPNQSPRLRSVIISNLLNIEDFDNFYNSVDVKEFSKEHSDELSERFGQWYLGDCLTNCLWDYLENLTKMGLIASKSHIEELTLKLIDIYTFYTNFKENTNYIYIKSDIEHNGECLYRRVRKDG
jgi:hypothetical protein